MADTRCPSKGKRKFTDLETAEASLTTIWRRGHGNGPGPLPCRVYLCRCGYYHLTSKALFGRTGEPGEVVSTTTNPPTTR